MANSERFFPKAWIAPSRIDVTDEFLDYAQPLIGEDWVSVPMVKGLPRFARITPEFAPRKLPEYVPQTYLTASFRTILRGPGHAAVNQSTWTVGDRGRHRNGPESTRW